MPAFAESEFKSEKSHSLLILHKYLHSLMSQFALCRAGLCEVPPKGPLVMCDLSPTQMDLSRNSDSIIRQLAKPVALHLVVEGLAGDPEALIGRFQVALLADQFEADKFTLDQRYALT
jgi:hypothetical protein